MSFNICKNIFTYLFQIMFDYVQFVVNNLIINTIRCCYLNSYM